MAPRPKAWTKRLFNAPSWLYDRGLGWLLGRRFCEVEHVGRKSGKRRTTVLEIVERDPATGEIVVASAYGATANWYRNLQQRPATKIRTGRQEYVPETRFLTPEEGRAVAERFGVDHRWEAKVGLRVMDAIDAVPAGTFDDPVEMFASFPMVAFKPSAPAVL